MAKQAVIADLLSDYASKQVLNANFAALNAAFLNTLSLDGSTPNQMAAALDMNLNRIINLGAPVNLNDAARLADVLAPGAVPVDFYFFCSGKPQVSQNFWLPMNRAILIPASLAGSHFKIGVLPTSTTTWTILKNTVSVGTVAFATSGAATATFTADVSFVAGDLFQLQAPSSQDATAADIAFNLTGTRV